MSIAQGSRGNKRCLLKPHWALILKPLETQSQFAAKPSLPVLRQLLELKSMIFLRAVIKCAVPAGLHGD